MDLDRSSALQAQLGNLERVSRAVQFDTFVGIIACLVFSCISLYSSANQLIALSPIVAAVGNLIIWSFSRLFQKQSPPLTRVRQWENLFITLNALVGIGWGIMLGTALFYSELALTYTAMGFVTVLIIGKLSVYAGIALATPAFSIPALLPAGMQLAVGGESFSAPTLTSLLLCAATLAITYFASQKIHDIAKNNAETESRLTELQALLDQRRTQVEKLNVALKTNEDKRHQVETNLRKASADLGLAAGKAQALATTLERVSPICQVTGLANRRHFDENLQNEWRRAMREEEPVSIIIIGIDEFAAYLDHNGAQAAETLLKRTGQTIKGFGRRAGDMAGRYNDTN